MSSRALLILPFVLFFFPSTVARNITIDDTDTRYFTWTEPDVFPRPLPAWAAVSPSSPCNYCSEQPPTGGGAVYNATWHDGHNGSQGSLTFQGAAVSIYGIAGYNSANVSFVLDGQPAGWYAHLSPVEFTFHALFFHAAGLSDSANHTVAWDLALSRTNGTSALFDYAVVEVPDGAGVSSSASSGAATQTSSADAGLSPSKHSSAGAIAGGVVGGVAALALLLIALLMAKRRRVKDAAGVESQESALSMRTARPFSLTPQALSSTAPATEHANSDGTGKTLDVGWTQPTAASLAPDSALAAPVHPSTTSPTAGSEAGSRDPHSHSAYRDSEAPPPY
ncbi:unnamed protein product [Mycena citricolor]|uniref:Uncharacterized protein n=1 Tax=Mycena citricolor TaxID=2018698 RepID=A0AAD2HYJ6_9AGAR|nr:unnamed protein product [Mycena citricolor]